MANELYFTHPNENLLATATSVAVTTGTPLDTYGVDKLFDGVWHSPLKIEELDLDVDMEWASPVVPALSIIGNSNITVAAELWGHTDNTFGGGTPDVTITFGVPTLNKFGFFTSPFQVPDPAVAAKTNWRLRIVGNDYPVSIGEFGMFAQARGLAKAYVIPKTKRIISGTISYDTPAGVDLAYEQMTSVRAVDGFFLVQSEDEVTDVEDLFAATRGRARPFFIVPSAITDDAWMVRFTNNELTVTPYGAGANRIDAPIKMTARGLAHIDPDDIP